MACDAGILKNVPLFALLDDEELAVLAGQVEWRTFAPRQRIYRRGGQEGRAYVVVSGQVRVTTVDEDGQELVIDEPKVGEVFGLASMLDQMPHQTNAEAVGETACVEVDREDIMALIRSKPLAGLDMLTVVARQIHMVQELVRVRATRNPNELIEEKTTFAEHIADAVAHFGGSWSFILSFGAVLVIYTAINVHLGAAAWDPYPFILLNLFLSMLAAVQAPVIMMSQNRQDAKDRLRSELDFEVNRRAAADIQGLARKLNTLDEKIGDVEDLLREKLK